MRPLFPNFFILASIGASNFEGNVLIPNLYTNARYIERFPTMISIAVFSIIIYVLISAPPAVYFYRDKVREVVFMNLYASQPQELVVCLYALILLFNAGVNCLPLYNINSNLFPELKKGLPMYASRLAIVIILVLSAPCFNSITNML